MNETLEKLGQELRRYFAPVLRRPMNWHMIDALVKIEEIEEAKQQMTEVAQPSAAKSCETPDRDKDVKPSPWK